MNTNTSLLYLGLAIAKASDPMHPNFRRALEKNPKNLLMHQAIRLAAARAVDANKDNPRGAIVATLMALKNDTQSYVTFLKGLTGDVAFAAHMDCVQFDRANAAVDPDSLDAGLDAMGVVHEIVDDVPAYDAADSLRATTYDAGDGQRVATREPYAGGEAPPPVADNLQDAYDAVKAAQAWLTQAVAGMPEDSQVYWGVDGLLPFAQRKEESAIPGEFNYVPVRDFDEYRELQRALWKAKQRTVDLPVDTESAMLAS